MKKGCSELDRNNLLLGTEKWAYMNAEGDFECPKNEETGFREEDLEGNLKSGVKDLERGDEI